MDKNSSQSESCLISKESTIALGSASPIKISALRSVFPKSNIQGFNVDSGVRSQPIGKKETRQGAYNRAKEALRKSKDCNWSIGIENGMWKREGDDDDDDDDEKGDISDGGWVDGAVVIAICRKQKHEDVVVELWGETIDIPKILPFERGPNGEWSILKDPHRVLTYGEKCRKDFLMECLSKLVEI